MHPNSMRLMGDFIARHLPGGVAGLKVLDVGSQNINGSYRELFGGCAEYVGVDIVGGAGVDILATDMDNLPFATGTFDVVISGQTLEHAAHPWILMKEMSRIVKPGGKVCAIAPWKFHEHKDELCPYDRWRILSDGMRTLMEEAGLVVLEAFMHEEDCFGAAVKPAAPAQEAQPDADKPETT